VASAGPAERRLFLFVKDSTDVLEEQAMWARTGVPHQWSPETKAVGSGAAPRARDEIFVRDGILCTVQAETSLDWRLNFQRQKAASNQASIAIIIQRGAGKRRLE
jgi:hypothetical protein